MLVRWDISTCLPRADRVSQKLGRIQIRFSVSWWKSSSVWSRMKIILPGATDKSGNYHQLAGSPPRISTDAHGKDWGHSRKPQKTSLYPGLRQRSMVLCTRQDSARILCPFLPMGQKLINHWGKGARSLSCRPRRRPSIAVEKDQKLTVFFQGRGKLPSWTCIIGNPPPARKGAGALWRPHFWELVIQTLYHLFWLSVWISIPF